MAISITISKATPGEKTTSAPPLGVAQTASTGRRGSAPLACLSRPTRPGSARFIGVPVRGGARQSPSSLSLTRTWGGGAQVRMALRMARTRRPPPLQLCGQHRRRHRELRVQRRAERPSTALEAAEAAAGDAGGDEGSGQMQLAGGSWTSTRVSLSFSEEGVGRTALRSTGDPGCTRHVPPRSGSRTCDVEMNKRLSVNRGSESGSTIDRPVLKNVCQERGCET